ncbi:Zinc finger CCCH domain-containing protein 55 [Bienertia sinuspersici]
MGRGRARRGVEWSTGTGERGGGGCVVKVVGGVEVGHRPPESLTVGLGGCRVVEWWGEVAGGGASGDGEHVSQLHMPHYDTVNSRGAEFEKIASERWGPRRWTGGSGTMSTGLFGVDRFRQDKGPKPVCRDNLREQMKNDSRNRYLSRGHRSRSPCRRFQSGRCYNGASCPYWHPELARDGRPAFDSSLEQKRVGRAVRDADFGEGYRDNTLKTSQEPDEANKDTSFRTMRFSGERRSRSPCRNFLRGKCTFGASCKRFHPVGRSRHERGTQHQQGVAATSSHPGFVEGSRDVILRTSRMHEETDFHNRSRAEDRFREPRGRSPCRYFLSANAIMEHHVFIFTLSLFMIEQDMTHGVLNSIKDFQHLQEPQILQNKAWSTKDDMWVTSNRVDEDVASRSRSSDRQSSRSASNFGGNKLGRGFALISPRAEAAGASRNFSGAIQQGNTLEAQEHDDDENYKMSFGENKHAVNSLVSSDGCYDKEVTGRSVCDMEPKIHDQKGDVPAINGRECEIAGEDIANFRSSGEGREDISLWSHPSRRQKGRSRSPFTPRADSHCRKPRRFDSRVDFCRDRCYNVAQFQSPDRRSYKYERPMYHANSRQPSKGETSSVTPRVDNNSKLVSPQRHVEVATQCLQLDQCLNSSLDSNIAAASKNNEGEPARCALQHSHKVQNDEELAKDSIAVDSTEGAAAIGREVSESDLTSSCSEDYILPAAVDLTSSGKEGNAEMIVDTSQESNEKAAELMSTMKTYSRKKSRKKRLRSVSSEETMKEAVTNGFERMPTSSLVETCSINPIILSSVSGVPVDIKTSASKNKDLENVLLQDDSVKKKKNKKRKKKCSQSVSCEETMKEEKEKKRKKRHPKAVLREETMKEGMPSSSLPETSSSDLNILSASGVPDYLKLMASKDEDLETAVVQLKKRKKRALILHTIESPTSGVPVDDDKLSSSQINDMENVLISDGPAKRQDNESMTNVTVENVESVHAATEDGILLVGNAHSDSLLSLPKAVVPNLRRKLLVLDVNGLLADIVAYYPRRFKPDTTVSAKAVFKRPFCDEFLQFCFARFNVGIWSSRTRKNVNTVVNFLMKDTKKNLLFCWGQSRCTATGYQTIENKEKPLVLKELRHLWITRMDLFLGKRDFITKQILYCWMIHHTRLYGILHFSHPYTFRNVQDKSLGKMLSTTVKVSFMLSFEPGPCGDLRLYLERLAEAENVQKFIQENPFGQKPITNTNSAWAFYSKIACTCGIAH